MLTDEWLSYLTALGLGLLIGTERERHKGHGPVSVPAGLRSFAIAALLGAVSWQLGQSLMLMLALLAMAALAALSYSRSSNRDPGLTTEITLLLTTLLGALAMSNAALAASLAVIVTFLLAARTPLHSFVRHSLTDQEMHDLILLAAAALVILPIAPDHTIDPLQSLNPHTIWLIVVVMLSISAIGHIAGRALGAKQGLPLAGFVSGFISSAATISALGSRAKAEPNLHAPAVAGAVLSTVSTFVQLALLIGVLNRDLLGHFAPALLGGGGMALLYGLIFTYRASKSPNASLEPNRRPLNPVAAFTFALIVTLVSFIVAALDHVLGETGAALGAAVAGLADTHAAAASIATLHSQGTMDLPTCMIAILAAMTTNTFTKIALARAMGTPAFAREVIPGLLLVIGAAWAGLCFWPQ